MFRNNTFFGVEVTLFDGVKFTPSGGIQVTIRMLVCLLAGVISKFYIYFYSVIKLYFILFTIFTS